MTAVAARWLSRCAKYVEVTPVAVTAASEWLARMQQDDGSWGPAPALKNDPRAQAPLPLTAHALLALVQAKVSSAVIFSSNFNFRFLSFLTKKNQFFQVPQTRHEVFKKSLSWLLSKLWFYVLGQGHPLQKCHKQGGGFLGQRVNFFPGPLHLGCSGQRASSR